MQGNPNTNSELLSVAQIETLRLVFEQKNSKEIARIMGVSPHTVDERVRRVLKKMNVSSRMEAATILARNGVFDQVTVDQPLRYQSPGLGETGAGDEAGTRRGPIGRLFDIGLPVPTTSQPINRHGAMERIIWPILIAVATIMAFFALYSLLVGLGRILG